MSNLQPKQFFHGTTAKLNPGDTVLPAAKSGRHNWDDIDSLGSYAKFATNRTWVADHPSMAAEYAHFSQWSATEADGDPTVYEVGPTTRPRTARSDNGYHTRSAIVKRALTPHEVVQAGNPHHQMDNPEIMDDFKERANAMNTAATAMLGGKL